MQESDSFSAWLQWQCSVVVVVVVIFKAGKNTSTSMCVVARGHLDWPHVGQTTASQAEQGMFSLFVPPNAPQGMGQGPGRLLVGYFIANKQIYKKKSRVLFALFGE